MFLSYPGNLSWQVCAMPAAKYREMSQLFTTRKYGVLLSNHMGCLLYVSCIPTVFFRTKRSPGLIFSGPFILRQCLTKQKWRLPHWHTFLEYTKEFASCIHRIYHRWRQKDKSTCTYLHWHMTRAETIFTFISRDVYTGTHTCMIYGGLHWTFILASVH